MFDQLILTLAQEDAPPSPPTSVQEQDPVTQEPGGAPLPDVGPSRQRQGMEPMIFVIFGALVVMIIFSMSGQRREKKKRQRMLGALKKGDKVQTIGGMLGAVVEVRDEHVMVKIDENTNTRVKFSRSAIQSVLQDKED